MINHIPRYSLAERDRRWDLARDIMAAEGLDALIAYGEHECVDLAPFAPDAYFTNDRPGSIVIFCGDADPVQLTWSTLPIADHIEATRRGDDLWIAPRNIRVARHAAGVVEVLREHRIETGAVGVLGLDPYPPFHINPIMPYRLWSEVLAELPGVRFVPVGLGYLFATTCQSKEELDVIAYSAATGDAMARAMLEAAAPGVSEADVYAAGMATAFRRGVAAPGMLLSTGPGFVSWGPPVWSYRPQEPRILQDGDVIMAEVFCRFGMKETQHQVAIAVGEPHPDILTAAEIARAGYEAGLAAARPGNTFGDLVEAMEVPLREADAWNVHPLVHLLNPMGPVCGFGAGLRRLPEAGRYGRLFDVPTMGGELPLAPGMTFAFEPNAVVGGRLANLGGTVVIGDDDPVELNPFTAQLLRSAS
ncbi:M24 family metallopeptidase [Streptosporangium sandarakinum]|uniref:M24 family metallopeptidase n=1 Tax=Streptosporangium sandarakinum TaxID=1260955 RepID=UPI0033A959AB